MSALISNMQDTWNDASVKYDGIKMQVTDINSQANSSLLTITINNSDRFVVNKSGEIVKGTIVANNIIGYFEDYQEYLDLANEAVNLASIYGSAKLYESWALLNAVTGTANTAAIITSDPGTHTDLVSNTTVTNNGLYFWNTSPPTWKWVDNTVAYYAFESAVNANTSATVAVSAATAASAVLSLVETLAVTQRIYYPTLAAGVAGTAVGDLFTTDEGGTWAYYRRTSTAPFYSLYKFVITEDYINSSVVGGANVYENWIALGTTSAANGTVGVILTNDSGTHTDPIMANTVNNSGVYIRYPVGWKRIANTEAFDAYRSSLSANTSMNIATAAAMVSVASANSAAFAYDALKNVALSEGLYYPTIAGGVANTSNGFIFTSDEGGSWNYYKKTTTAPFYEYFANVTTPVISGVISVYEFVAANNQNTFVTDTNLSQVNVSVFANGFRLQTTDYTTNGNNVILDTNRANNDVIAVEVITNALSSLPSSVVRYSNTFSYNTGTVGRELNKIQVQSRNFANDSLAAVGGVAVGDFYHANGIVRVRLT